MTQKIVLKIFFKIFIIFIVEKKEFLLKISNSFPAYVETCRTISDFILTIFPANIEVSAMLSINVNLIIEKLCQESESSSVSRAR